MPRVIHFEINADDPRRAAGFYAAVFDWKINTWGGPEAYWLCETGKAGEPGINGAIMQRSAPGETTVNSIDVPSVDEYLLKIEKNGGKALTPKMNIPGIGWFAYCQDTEGNKFGIMQSDSSVK
jgi:predicted enzyme related to lactoylglutathione lyase